MRIPTLWHVRAQQRAKSRHDAASAHIVAFITTGEPTPYTPYRFVDLPRDDCGFSAEYDYYRESPWRAAPWAASRAA